jgi:hypothetical protein
MLFASFGTAQCACNIKVTVALGVEGEGAHSLQSDTAIAIHSFQREKFDEHFQPLQVNDIVWDKDRTAPKDGPKKKHSLGLLGVVATLGRSFLCCRERPHTQAMSCLFYARVSCN